jgi:lipoate-protein ligase A
MKIIQLDSQDVYFNLAAEEHLFSQFEDTEPCFLIWQNKNAVVVGKHQNTLEEVDLELASRLDVQVARRLSGGGAVYHDLGNLNYSIILHSEEMRWDIKRMADPVVEALRRAGVDVDLNQRNDLLIAGKKISGSSQYIRRNRLLHHGTLLFHSDLEMLSKALKSGHDCIQSRSIKSVRSQVTNIRDHYPNVTIPDFISTLKNVLAEASPVETNTFSEQDFRAISLLRDEKYSTWDWIYARSPEYSISKKRPYNGGELEIAMVIKNGTIQALDIDAVDASQKQLDEIEKCLIGVKMRAHDIAQAIETRMLGRSLPAMAVADLVRALIN